jgi:nucleoid DNA-binding protein/cell division septation protein DedD
MKIDVGVHIAELLFDHSSVNIPGLGGFTTHYRRATYDQIQGVMKPPSKDIRFNENLGINDGMLVGHIMDRHQLGQQEAQKIVADYVEQILASMKRKEMVVFPKVGRLYRDYKGTYEFLPDNTNFNPDAFGLPNIQFQPIVRSKEELQQQTPVAAAVNNPATDEKDFSAQMAAWVQKNFPLLISVSVIIIALIIFLLIYDNAPSPESVYKVPDEEVNLKKGEKGFPATAEDSLDPTNGTYVEDEEANAAVEEPRMLPNQKMGIIMIGLFGNENNISKLVKKLYDAGFEPYLEERGKYTRVGVQFAYENQSDIDEKLRIVQEEFEEDAIVWRK